MKNIFLGFVIVLNLIPRCFAESVTTCGDVMNIGDGARMILHGDAQSRAKQKIELFVEKKVVVPYVDALGRKAKPINMARLIEVYWCETQQTPLHSAYYRFYSSNKSVFNE
jgi:hypothetical protein